MKKLAFLLFVTLSIQVTAQELIPYRVDTKWGYADPSGKMVIAPAFDKAEFFGTDGFAHVSLDTLVTLIDKSGRQMMPFKYTDVFPFESGFAVVCKGGTFRPLQGEIIGGSWGFINDKFEEIIPCQFSRAQSFKSDYAIVQTDGNWGPWGVVNKEGKVVLPLKYKTYSFDMRPFPGLVWGTKPGILRQDISGRGGKWQLIDLKGQPVGKPYNAMHGDPEMYTSHEPKSPPPPRGQIEILDEQGQAQLFKSTLCKFYYLAGTNFLISVTSDGGTQYGIISGNNTTLVPLGRYRYINSNCSEGRTRVYKDNLVGYIDCVTGKEIVSPHYSYANDFNNGYAYVAYNYMSHARKGDGMINRDGLEFFYDTPAIHFVAQSFEFGSAYLLLDEHNYKIEPPWLRGAVINNHKGPYVMYTAKSKAGVAKILTTTIHHHAQWEDYCCPLFKDSKTFTAIESSDIRIQRVLTPGAAYDSSYFHETNDSIVVVTKSGKKGIVNLQGEEMVPPHYHEIVPFATKNGVHFTVWNEDGATGIVDAVGKVILPMEYDINFETPGYQVITKGELDRVGILKDGSKLIIPMEYGQIDPYIEWDENQKVKNIAFMAYKDERPSIIDSEGHIVFSDNSVSVETMGDASPAGIYFTLYKKKKNGVFKVGPGLILPIAYEYIESAFANNKIYFIIKQKKKYGLADENGKMIVPIVYKSIDTMDENDTIFLLTDQKSKVVNLTKAHQLVEQKDEN